MNFNLNALLLAIHLLAAAAWLGAGWYDRLIVSPVVKSVSDGGVEHIRHQIRKGGGAKWFAPASLLTVLSGSVLYWRMGINLESLSGIMVSAGAVMGLTALILGITVHGPAEKKLARAVDADNPSQILDLAHKLEHHTTFSAALVTAAFLLMALRHVAI